MIIYKPMETDEEMQGKGQVHYRSWQESYAGLVDEGYLARMSEEKCVALARKWPQNTIVAKENGKVVGFSCYSTDENNNGEVVALYVLQSHQGRKIGYALMNAAVEKLADCGSIMLWVLKGNEHAIRFYERYGFQTDGTEAPITLGTPNTMVHMVLQNNGDISTNT